MGQGPAPWRRCGHNRDAPVVERGGMYPGSVFLPPSSCSPVDPIGWMESKVNDKCVSLCPLGSRCHDGIRCARDSLELTVLDDKGEKAVESKGKPSSPWLTWGLWKERQIGALGSRDLRRSQSFRKGSKTEACPEGTMAGCSQLPELLWLVLSWREVWASYPPWLLLQESLETQIANFQP